MTWYINKQDWDNIVKYGSPPTYVIRCLFKGRDIGWMGAPARDRPEGRFETTDINLAHRESEYKHKLFPDTIYQVEEK